MQPFLSVIIPAHNEEKTICKTVYSLLVQDYPNFEIVVVDDGSNDATSKKLIDYFGFSQIETDQKHCLLEHQPIAKTWSSRCYHVRLYLIQKENGGKADALNAGIDFCHGEYFATVDADCILSINALSYLSRSLCESKSIAVVGGRVLPQVGLTDFFRQKGFHLREALQGYQELEYGIAFSIGRLLFDKLGTTMLVSGALGLYNKAMIMQLGGYALDTVGEDMELVMRIRRFAAESNAPYKIKYAEKAVCFTELPWNEYDLRKQRIRWAVGLAEVLWKYREMAICKKYGLLEKLTFWYYVLFGRFSPHIELASLIICIILGIVLGFPQTAIALIVIAISFRFLLAIVGSFQAIKDSVVSSENKFRSLLKLLLLLTTFLSAYQLWHSFCRLIAVPNYQNKKRKAANQKPSWVSPTRM